MTQALQVFDAFQAGLCIGAALILAVVLLRSPVRNTARIALILTLACGGAWVFGAAPGLAVFQKPPLWLAYPLYFAGMATGGLFWLAIGALFADWRLSALRLAPVIVLLAVSAVITVSPPSVGAVLWIVIDVVNLILAGHALTMIALGRRGDLVEGRRRLRGPTLAVLGLGAGVILMITLTDLAAGNRQTSDQTQVIIDSVIALSTIVFAVVLLETGGLFSTRQTRPPREVDDAVLARLEALMGEGQAWRQEGLGVADLALRMDMPDHQLRRLINGSLGHRNFAAFVNAYRIAEAKRRLADPAEARTTVAQIAFDLGFGSLNPFNRAFKAETGQTPTEWRRNPRRN